MSQSTQWLNCFRVLLLNSYFQSTRGFLSLGCSYLVVSMKPGRGFPSVLSLSYSGRFCTFVTKEEMVYSLLPFSMVDWSSSLDRYSVNHSEAGTPMLWPRDVKNWLLRKDPDAGKDWRQEEEGMTEDETFGCHHWLNGHEFE